MGYLNRKESAPSDSSRESSSRGNEGKRAESEWRRKSSEHTTEKLVPEEAGIMLEFKIGTETKGTAVRLDASQFIGSKHRQDRLTQEVKDSKKLFNKLHVAELTAETRLPGTDKKTSQRVSSYVLTPDGRVHSSESRVRNMYDETARKAGFREAHEKRTFSPDGRVLSIRRVADRIDGDTVYNEIITEELGYNAKGQVATRETRITRDRELTYHTQQMLDAKETGSTVTHVLLDQRPDVERHKPGSSYKTRDAADFQNGFHSDNLELLED